MNNKYPHMKDIHLSHVYDVKIKEWKFNGYTCSKCGRTFKRPGFIEKHEESCKPSHKLVEKPEPKDFNQKKSLQGNGL